MEVGSIYIRYEKLPAICKFCGVINHGGDECNESYTLRNIPSSLSDWAEMPIQECDELSKRE